MADAFYFSSNNPVVSKFLSTGQTVFSLAATLFIIKGIMNLSEALERKDMFEKGRTVLTIVLIFNIVTIICNLLSAFFQMRGTLGTIISVAGAISSVLTIVYLILYLSYLGKAGKMLEAAK
ncbi:MAG: hypothetical protein IJM90_06780 [Firmicutes bacterium]|nr:hypothetical protein [Bacillota bacterium]